MYKDFKLMAVGVFQMNLELKIKSDEHWFNNLQSGTLVFISLCLKKSNWKFILRFRKIFYLPKFYKILFLYLTWADNENLIKYRNVCKIFVFSIVSKWKSSIPSQKFPPHRKMLKFEIFFQNDKYSKMYAQIYSQMKNKDFTAI